MTPSFKTFFPSAAASVALIILGVVGYSALDQWKHRQCRESYTFVNTREVCGMPDTIKKTGYVATQGRIEKYIADRKDAGHVTEVSVYFRDLESGPVFGIEETADFAPASLLKLPTALVYLTQAERDPSTLTKELSVANPQWNFIEHFPSKEGKIDPRVPHTIEELIEHMLKHSDNNAYGVLQTHLYETGQQSLIRQTFLELGFIDPDDINDEVLSVRRYAAIFRALYNISYINAELSEKVLEWLTDSEFTEGIVSGVPKDVVVAHKFGERFNEDGTKQLHDCGIIYFPQNPYTLCVMTKGDDFSELTKIISTISKEVYREVESRRL